MTFPLGRISVEIQTINKRFLEIQLSMPKELLRFDLEIRKWISNRVSRGTMTVRIEMLFSEKSPCVVQPNLPLVRQLKQAWQQIYREWGVPAESSLNPRLLLQEEALMLYSEEMVDEEAYRNPLKESVEKTLDLLIAMREREGAVLYIDIKERLDNLRVWIEEIAARSTTAVETYRKKLTERIGEAMQGSIENEERILREVCVYADRIDISEEIVRFRSHLDHFIQIVEGTETAVGKTLDFILQELSREVNTIGAKNSDSETAKRVIATKGELEKIREQVQNVE